MLYAILLIVVGYLSGSLPFGVWVAQTKGIDLRKMGSGSTGATNVYRCVGKKEGVFVFFTDILKGTLPVLLAILCESRGLFAGTPFEYPGVVPVLVAIFAMVGHSKSPFLGFQGGKSAATGLGTLFALNPLGGFLTMITFLAGCFAIRIVSVSSILAVFMCMVYFYFLGAPKVYVGFCVFGFLYVTYRHKANIKRLMDGTEPRIGDKPKPTTPDKNSDTKSEQTSDSNKGSIKDGEDKGAVK